MTGFVVVGVLRLDEEILDDSTTTNLLRKTAASGTPLAEHPSMSHLMSGDLESGRRQDSCKAERAGARRGTGLTGSWVGRRLGSWSPLRGSQHRTLARQGIPGLRVERELRDCCGYRMDGDPQ